MRRFQLLPIHAKLLLLIFLVASWFAGCSNAPHLDSQAASTTSTTATSAATAAATSDLALLEIAFRDELRLASHDEPVFLSLAPIGEAPVDPPAALFAKLTDLKSDLKSASMSEHINYRGVFDRNTKKKGTIYWVRINEHVSDQKVKVEAGHWSGLLSAGGGEVSYELKDGTWIPMPTDTVRRWVY